MGLGVTQPETLREIFVYLYRCWVQKHLGETPEMLALSQEDGILTSSTFAMYYSNKPIEIDMALDLRKRFKQPLLLIAPAFPKGFLGTSDLANPTGVGHPFQKILSIVNDNLVWLEAHHERSLHRREAYETQEQGRFEVWRAAKVTRLLLYPRGGELYGYAIIRNAPKDFFFRKSRSCRQEGSKVGCGEYKRCTHRVEDKAHLNLDLLDESGGVLLLHLTLAGAGYKVFPREAPEPQAGPW